MHELSWSSKLLLNLPNKITWILLKVSGKKIEISEYLQNLCLNVPLPADVTRNCLGQYRTHPWTTEVKHTENFLMKKNTYIHSFICSFSVMKSWKAGTQWQLSKTFPIFSYQHHKLVAQSHLKRKCWGFQARGSHFRASATAE